MTFGCKKIAREYIVPELRKKDNCSNEVVKKLVTQSIKEQLSINLVLLKKESAFNFSSYLLKDLEVLVGDVSKQSLSNEYRIEVEKVLNNRISSLNSEDIIIIKKSTEQIEQNFKSISHNRITEENKDLNICKCKASIEFNNGYNYDFAYSVQETETHYYTELINMFEFNFIEILKNLDFTYKPKIKEFNKTNQSKIKSNIKSDSYYKNQIRSLLKTEDTRNFDEVIKYYNLKNLKRYWNISNPSYTELSEAYKKSWNTTVNSSNSINRIEKKYERVYDTNLDFTFFHKRKEEWKTINSTVRFVFGENDKIIEVYGIEK